MVAIDAAVDDDDEFPASSVAARVRRRGANTWRALGERQPARRVLFDAGDGYVVQQLAESVRIDLDDEVRMLA